MSEVAQVAYAWVIDGISTIIVDDEVLDDTWAVAQGFVSTLPGLELPTGLEFKVNLRTAVPESTTATIKVRDVTNGMPAIFKGNYYDKSPLVTTLDAGDTGGAAVYGKQVGTEAIGAAGQRRRYSCVPGFNVGLKHLGQNEAFANNIGTTPVSDHPILLEGRRCCVYRVKNTASGWQSLADSKRIWWGTLRGRGEQHLGRWSFACLGPESWLGGNLGRGRFEEGLCVIPLLSLRDDGLAGETVLRGDLYIINMQNLIEQQADAHHVYVDRIDNAIGTDITYLPGADSYADVTAAVNSFLDDLVGFDNGGGAFNSDANDISFGTGLGTDGITVKWRRGDSLATGDPNVEAADVSYLAACLRLTAHEKVWRTLGYDPRLQNSDRDPVSNAEQYGRFEPSSFEPGYWDGYFYSADAKVMKAVEDNAFGPELTEENYQTGAAGRRWPPLYPGGAVSFDGTPGQEIQIDTAEPMLLAGSKSRPLMADPDDNTTAWSLGGGVGDVTHQGLMVFEGPYRRRGDDDQVDPIAGYAFEVERERREGRTAQVARVCWRASSDGTVSTDSDGWPRFVIYEWLEPRLHGFDYKLFTGTWGGFRLKTPNAEPITARSLASWDYSAEGDKSLTVVRRILLTTGTAGEWYSDAGLTTQLYGLGGDEAYLDVGDNDDGATVPGDAEDASLGLGIPSSMVAAPEAFDAVGELVGPQLRRCKVGGYSAISATKLIAGLLRPLGVALGYAGGKFTPFDPWKFPTPTDAVVSWTQESLALRQGQRFDEAIPRQQLRKWGPIDRLELRGRVELRDGDYVRTVERASTDAGAAYRSQQLAERVDAPYLVHPSIPTIGSSWENDLIPRWREGFAFWGTPHTVVKIPVHAEEGVDVYPGEGVLYTDPWALDGAGGYGMSVATGLVLGRSFDAERERFVFEVLLAAESEFRMYAPSAVVYRYDENDLGQGYRLLCYDDHFGDRGGNTYDVDGFAEPSWSTEGGSADIEVFSFDGTTWTGGIYGTVSSVNGAASDSYITLTGALTGATWYRDQHHIVVLRNWANQGAAWVRRWYAPICESDGTHSGGTAGKRFRGI